MGRSQDLGPGGFDPDPTSEPRKKTRIRNPGIEAIHFFGRNRIIHPFCGRGPDLATHTKVSESLFITRFLQKKNILLCKSIQANCSSMSSMRSITLFKLVFLLKKNTLQINKIVYHNFISAILMIYDTFHQFFVLVFVNF